MTDGIQHHNYDGETVEVDLAILPDALFENKHSKNALLGTLILAGHVKIEELFGLKIRVPDNKPKVDNIKIRVEGKIEARINLHIHEDDCEVKLGRKVRGAYLFKLWGNTKLVLHERSTSNYTEIWVQQNGEVNIGRDCMFAHDVLIMCGDMHGIFDIETKTQLNASNPKIVIGSHVWLGRRSVICKNTTFGCGSIVGISSVVTKSFSRSVAVGGNPAKLIKSNVSWCRNAICSERDIDSVLSLLN